MHPIHYSLIFNFLTLVITGGLAFYLKEPWLVITALLLCNHSMARFQEDEDEPDDDQPMGFMADVK